MSDQTTLPISDSEPKRGWWTRLTQFSIVRMLLALVMVSAVVAVLQVLFLWLSRDPAVKHFLAVTYLQAVAGTVGVLLTYGGYVRWIEQRPVAELGHRGALPEAILGVLLGGGMFAATMAILAGLGVFHSLGVDSWAPVTGAAVGALLAAVFEEILFRAIIFRLTERSLGTWLAVVISALLFGAIHLLNKNANLQAGIAIALEAGIFLAAAFITTRRLWFVIGAHFGWNFVEGGIFGTAVSGNASHGLLKGTITGPTYLTGGAFGVESSVVAIAVCLFVALLLLFRARSKGATIAPFWLRGSEPLVHENVGAR